MSRVDVTVRKLRRSDVRATAELLAAAFGDNPCYAFMHPRAATRAGDLRAFFLRNLEWHRSLDLTWVAVGPDDHPIGTVTLEPPGGVPGRLDQAIRHWVVPTWRDQGLETVRRLLSIDAEFKGEYRRLCHRKTYWHVHAVAVSPQEQGRGVGGAMLSHTMRELDALVQARPAPVVLSTQREANVRLYERFGFELRDCVQMGERSRRERFRSWFMQRRSPAGPPGSR